MKKKELNVVRYKDLPLGGFAGIVEKHLARNPQIWRVDRENKSSNGLKDFIYLSMGYFKPNDGAPIHPHKDVDIVSFIYEGEIGHKGSLGNGSKIKAPGVQVQRAGTGMTHSEFSTTNKKANFAQIWFTPPEFGLAPDYQNFLIDENELVTVYGGDNNTFKSNMICKIGFLGPGKELHLDGDFVLILFEGTALINDIEISKRDLIEGENLDFVSETKVGLIVIQENKK